MRVLQVLEALEGGTSRHVVDLVRWTPDVEQHVAIPGRRVGGVTDEAAAPALRALGAEVHPVAMTRSPPTPANARSLLALVRLIRRVRPDVIHTHSSIGGLLGRVAGAITRVPTVYTPNGVTDVRAGVLVEQALRPVTARLVAVSTSEAERVRRLRLVAADRVRVVPNGIDLERDPEPFALRAHLGLPDDVPLVGTISRLVPQKDPLTWVAMAALVTAHVPDARFVVIGDGALRDEVSAAVRAAGLDGRLHLVAHLPEADRALTSLDVFVMSSVFEGAPYAPMEAMPAGVPLVLTDVAGSADLVDDGVDGRLVPARDPAALAVAVVEQLTDRHLAEKRAGEARVTVAERFGGPEMGRRTRAVYAELARPGVAVGAWHRPQRSTVTSGGKGDRPPRRIPHDPDGRSSGPPLTTKETPYLGAAPLPGPPPTPVAPHHPDGRRRPGGGLVDHAVGRHLHGPQHALHRLPHARVRPERPLGRPGPRPRPAGRHLLGDDRQRAHRGPGHRPHRRAGLGREPGGQDHDRARAGHPAALHRRGRRRPGPGPGPRQRAGRRIRRADPRLRARHRHRGRGRRPRPARLHLRAGPAAHRPGVERADQEPGPGGRARGRPGRGRRAAPRLPGSQHPHPRRRRAADRAARPGRDPLARRRRHRGQRPWPLRVPPPAPAHARPALAHRRRAGVPRRGLPHPAVERPRRHQRPPPPDRDGHQRGAGRGQDVHLRGAGRVDRRLGADGGRRRPRPPPSRPPHPLRHREPPGRERRAERPGHGGRLVRVGLTGDAVTDDDPDRGYPGRGSLFVLPAGNPVSHPAELLGGPRTAQVLEALGEHADFVLIDTPPVLPVADALGIGRLVSGALLVVETGRVPLPAVQRAKAELTRNQIRVLGMVLNRFEDQGSIAPYHYDYTAAAAPSATTVGDLSRLLGRSRNGSRPG